MRVVEYQVPDRDGDGTGERIKFARTVRIIRRLADSYPRVVKRARHNSHRVKRPGDTGTRHDGPATIELVNAQPLTLTA